jgi:glycosyltransferase involved in cell wall biosynthesis
VIRVDAVIETLGPGGAERLLVDTAARLDRTRFELRVFTLFPGGRHHAAGLAATGTEERCLGLSGPRDVARGVVRLRRAWRDRRPDLVHTHLYAANLVGRGAAWLSRVPAVSTLHDADYEPITRLGNPGLSRWKHALVRVAHRATLALAGADVLAVSGYVAESARRRLGLDPARITVVPNGVDTDVFRPGDASARAAARRALGAVDEEGLVLGIGRLTPQKGFGLLLEAIARLRTHHPRTRLVLAGDGGQRSVLDERVRALRLGDGVSFLGVRTDVPQLLRGADVVAVPSLHEGFGLVAAEAMASAVPVVASRTGPLPEIVSDGESGLLFPSGDAAALAAALDTLLASADLRASMGARGRVRAVERFSLPSMVSALEAVYERLAAPPPER